MEASELNLLLEYYRELSAIINEKVQVALENQPQSAICSPKTDLLADALSSAQGEYLELIYERVNSFTKHEYADLQAVLKATRAALSKYQVAFTQLLVNQPAGETVIHTRIEHKGEWLQSISRILLTPSDPRANGSLIALTKRWAAESILGIAGRNDYYDDDGVFAHDPSRKEFEKGLAVHLGNSKQSYETINATEVRELDKALRGYPDVLTDLYKQRNIQVLADLPKSMYDETISRARIIIAERERNR